MDIATKDPIALQCRAEYEAGLKYRHAREAVWHIIEDFYFNRTPKSLKSRFNVPVPIIPGFVETWTATMARHVTLNFEQQEEADYKACQKQSGEQIERKRLTILSGNMSHDKPAPRHGIGRQFGVLPSIMRTGPPFDAAFLPGRGQDLVGDLACSLLGDAEQHAVIVLLGGPYHREIATEESGSIGGRNLQEVTGREGHPAAEE